MGEGWGDFVALHMMVRDGDNFDGSYAVGVYDTQTGSSDAGYYAIRRYPMSVDRTKNALTFKHIANGVALPAGVPTFFPRLNNATDVVCACEPAFVPASKILPCSATEKFRVSLPTEIPPS